MSERGWKAKGKLTGLYKTLGGARGVAEVAGVSEKTINAVNGGSRNLGIEPARKIAAKTGMTLADLGAPLRVIEGDEPSELLEKRLEALERKQDALRRRVARVEKVQSQIEEAQERIRHQEGGTG